MPIGSMPSLTFKNATYALEAGSHLSLVSDGVYEIPKPAGGVLTCDAFVAFLSHPSLLGTSDIDRILRCVQEVGGSETFADDFSLLHVRFA